MRRDRRICIYIDKEIDAGFQEYCKEYRKTMSTAIMDLIVKELIKEGFVEVKK